MEYYVSDNTYFVFLVLKFKSMNTLPPSVNSLHDSLMQQQDTEAAWNIMAEYFDCFGTEAQENLWTFLVGALSSKHLYQAQKAVSRHDMIFFYEYTRVLLDACAVLQKQRFAMPVTEEAQDFTQRR